MNRTLILSLVLALLTLGPSGLQSTPDTIEIKSDFKSINVLSYGEMTIGPKRFQDLDTAQWQPTHGKYFTVPADRVGWLKLHLSNSDSLDRFLEMYLHSITVNYANIYISRNGHMDYSAATGNQIPWKDRATSRRDMSLPFVIKEGEDVVVYISLFRRGFKERYSLNLADVRNGDGTSWQDLLAFLDFGYVISIFILALIAAIRQKRMGYLLYALYVSGGALYLISSFGYHAILPPIFIGFIETAPVVFATISLLSFIFFARNLLGIKSIPSWFLLVINWCTPIVALVQLISCLVFAINVRTPFVTYHDFTFFSAGWLLFIFLGLMVLVSLKVFRDKNHEYTWFLGTFISLFLLVTMSVTLEYELLVLSQGEEIFLEFVFVTIEITVTLIFFTYYILQELDKEREEKLKADLKVKEQSLAYSNFVHSGVKGPLESVSIDLKHGANRESVLVQVDELIKYCKFMDSFTLDSKKDLYSLLKNIDLLNHSVLSNELQERSFHSSIDKNLIGVELQNPKDLNVLSLFIRDSISNIKKYANYNYAVLSAVKKVGPKGKEHVKIEIKDDGVGLASTLEIQQDTIFLNNENFQHFSSTFIGPRHTGMRRMFRAANEAGIKLELKSNATSGTSTSIFLQIQDRELSER